MTRATFKARIGVSFVTWNPTVPCRCQICCCILCEQSPRHGEISKEKKGFSVIFGHWNHTVPCRWRICCCICCCICCWLSAGHGEIYRLEKKEFDSFLRPLIPACPAGSRFVVALAVRYPHGTVRFTETKKRFSGYSPDPSEILRDSRLQKKYLPWLNPLLQNSILRPQVTRDTLEPRSGVNFTTWNRTVPCRCRICCSILGEQSPRHGEI